jgi:hypothetical protein
MTTPLQGATMSTAPIRLTLVLILTLLWAGTPAHAGTLLTPDALPDTITFQGRELTRAFTEEKDGAFIVEYIPEGETLEHWTALFAVRLERSDLTPVQRAQALAKTLVKLNPQFKAQVLVNTKTGIAGVDFLMWPADESYGEFNSWKFVPAREHALYSYQYARRGYAHTPTFDALLSFMKHKQKAVSEMMAFELPAK